jgi:hypothetical protein
VGHESRARDARCRGSGVGEVTPRGSTRTTTTSTNGVRTHDSFEWSQKLEAGKTLEIKGINGDIHVMLGADKREVTAEKHARRAIPTMSRSK